MATTFAAAVLRVVPPWLQRTVGREVMQGLVDELDALKLRTRDGVAARFPGSLEEALPLLGRQRRIRRGPGESATTYARRLRGWWDAHRTRGGPYALLEQLRAFFLDWLSVRMDVLYHSGTRRWMDTDGVITRDAVSWGADGTPLWAQVWIFLYVPVLIPRASSFLVTSGGDFIVTSGGDFILVRESIAPSEITPDEEEVFTAIPRDWSAAHVKTTNVVLLWEDRRLWNYPQPVPTWAEWGATSTWAEPPVVLEIEG